MMHQTYKELLTTALQSGPDWPASARLPLMMAVALYIQQQTMKGIPYGAEGMPNMQTLLEIGAVFPEEFEQFYKHQISEWVHGTFLPFLLEQEKNAVYLDPRQFAH